MSRRSVIVIVVFMVLGGLGVVLVCAFPFDDSSDVRPFDGAIWRAGSIRERGRMVRDLESSNSLLGLDRDEVVAVLGPTDASGCFGYQVDIGHKFGSVPWTYFLCLSFDENGKVKRVYLFD